MEEVHVTDDPAIPAMQVNIDAQGGEGGTSSLGADGQPGQAGEAPGQNMGFGAAQPVAEAPAQPPEPSAKPEIDYSIGPNGVLVMTEKNGDTVLSERELTPAELTEIVVGQNQRIGEFDARVNQIFGAGMQYQARRVREALGILAPDEPRILKPPVEG